MAPEGPSTPGNRQAWQMSLFGKVALRQIILTTAHDQAKGADRARRRFHRLCPPSKYRNRPQVCCGRPCVSCHQTSFTVAGRHVNRFEMGVGGRDSTM